MAVGMGGGRKSWPGTISGGRGTRTAVGNGVVQIAGILAAAWVAIGALGCPWLRVNVVSMDEERQLGRQLSAEVDQELPLVVDPQIQAYVDGMGRRLVEALPEDVPGFEYRFRVVNGQEVNAFALPAGYIYIFRGLVEFSENEAQLAAVVAHEIAHVVKRHGTERLSQMYGVQLLLGAVLGENPAIWKNIVSQAVATVGFLSYTRSMESEADEIGVVLLHEAGWSAQGMVQFFERLHDMSGQPEDGVLLQVNRWLSTHPLTQDRVDATKETIEERNLVQGELDSAEFVQFRERMQQLPKP